MLLVGALIVGFVVWCIVVYGLDLRFFGGYAFGSASVLGLLFFLVFQVETWLVGRWVAVFGVCFFVVFGFFGVVLCFLWVREVVLVCLVVSAVCVFFFWAGERLPVGFVIRVLVPARFVLVVVVCFAGSFLCQLFIGAVAGVFRGDSFLAAYRFRRLV
ncbi:hypothetical protein [Collimonas sp. OK607]|uniref:hypothetical protein n=1 Tax=Collimonas sp. OK607 TaxID=1798194 RepID=UPI000B894E39|nr:hypothetical protein [Collimonas sp. OK607]